MTSEDPSAPSVAATLTVKQTLCAFFRAFKDWESNQSGFVIPHHEWLNDAILRGNVVIVLSPNVVADAREACYDINVEEDVCVRPISRGRFRVRSVAFESQMLRMVYPHMKLARALCQTHSNIAHLEWHDHYDTHKGAAKQCENNTIVTSSCVRTNDREVHYTARFEVTQQRVVVLGICRPSELPPSSK